MQHLSYKCASWCLETDTSLNEELLTTKKKCDAEQGDESTAKKKKSRKYYK